MQKNLPTWLVAKKAKTFRKKMSVSRKRKLGYRGTTSRRRLQRAGSGRGGLVKAAVKHGVKEVLKDRVGKEIRDQDISIHKQLSKNNKTVSTLPTAIYFTTAANSKVTTSRGKENRSVYVPINSLSKKDQKRMQKIVEDVLNKLGHG